MQLKRLSRTEAVLGEDAVQKLNDSFVVIAGLGGVGGYTLEALARSGVLHFRLVDFDRFDETNINRQILSFSSNVGNLKTDEAEKRLKEIDSSITVEKMPVFISEENIDEVLKDSPDLVVDAIDSVQSKCLLLTECKKRGIKVVSSMGAAMKKDVTSVRVSDLSKTFGCPLAKAVRSELKKNVIEDGISCVFSPEHIETDRSKKGSLPTVVGAFGLALAQIAMEELTK